MTTENDARDFEILKALGVNMAQQFKGSITAIGYIDKKSTPPKRKPNATGIVKS